MRRSSRLTDAQKIDPPIVVGIFNSPRRSFEYHPLAGGEDYARFLIGELKPMIDAQYRTLPDARHTGTMGSSAGGLVSIGLGWRHPDVFTRIGALSAHLAPIGEKQRRGDSRLGILDAIDALGPLDPALRIYVDRGDDEIDAQYCTASRTAPQDADWMGPRRRPRFHDPGVPECPAHRGGLAKTARRAARVSVWGTRRQMNGSR